MNFGDFELATSVRRLISRVKERLSSDSDSCICFTKPKEYHRIRVNHRKIRAHRVVWIVFNGCIPEGVFVCHSCDNPPCLNPNHLFLGTHEDNMRDMVNKGRTFLISGENHGQRKLTWDQVRTIRELYNQGNATQRFLSSVFGVSSVMVHKIVMHKKWNYYTKQVANWLRT